MHVDSGHVAPKRKNSAANVAQTVNIAVLTHVISISDQHLYNLETRPGSFITYVAIIQPF